MINEDSLKVALAQIASIWLNKQKTIDKITNYISNAGNQNCDLVVFGEGVLPGYPFWLTLTHSAEFNSKIQKEIHAHYIQNSIQIETGDLDEICNKARENKIAIYLGFIERAHNRGGHSLYCSLAFINKQGEIKSVHRKLQPTYEERLAWSPGDGHGLQVHQLDPFCVGGLNCWENWMPLVRSSLYAQGENLHVAVWPGAESITQDITRFVARESRSFVLSVSGLMRKEDFPVDTPHLNKILEKAPEMLADGGSCIAGPDGEWVVKPVAGKEELIIANLDINRVYEERQNFDPSGHYSRPDVTQLVLNRERQSTLKIKDE